MNLLKGEVAAALVGLRHLCIECESKDCCFNHEGECRFILVHEHNPLITENGGCLYYCYAVAASEGGEQA